MTPASPPMQALDRAVVSVIALGGGLGSLARYGLSQRWAPSPHGFPSVTLTINLTGSLLLGMLVVAVTEVWRPHHLLRPFLGTGVLGGYTTFSTFAVELRGLAAPVAWSYLILSVLGGITLAAAGMAAVRRLEPRFRISPTHEAVDPIDPDLP